MGNGANLFFFNHRPLDYKETVTFVANNDARDQLQRNDFFDVEILFFKQIELRVGNYQYSLSQFVSVSVVLLHQAAILSLLVFSSNFQLKVLFSFVIKTLSCLEKKVSNSVDEK